MMADSSQEPGENRAARLVPAESAGPVVRDGYGGYYGGYGAGLDEQDSFGQDLLEYWRIFYKRRWLILSIVVTSVVLALLVTMMMTPLYTATARIQIDREPPKVLEGGNVVPTEGGSNFEYLKTEYELLQSRAIAERVTSALNLAADEDFLKPRSFSLIGAIKSLFQPPSDEGPDKAALKRAATDVVLANLTVRPVPGSRLVDLSYTDPVPERAQRIAAAYAEAYIAANLDKRFQANAYAKTFLEDQIAQLKLRLEESERKMLEFAEREQIVIVTEKASIAENNLASANAALGQLISERIKNEKLWKQVADADSMNVPQVLTNSVVDGLRARRNELVAEYQQKLEIFKPTFPAMLEISSKIKEIDRQLANEVQAIKASLKAAYETSLSQEQAMRQQVEKLRAEVLDLQKRSIQYNILKREVDTNRALYNGLLQRFKEVDIAGGVGANNVFVVDRAQVPKRPSSPRKGRALLLALALGLGIGLGTAYLLEQLDDTIRTPEEIERLAGLATLGVIPKVANDQALVADFADPRSAISEAYRSLCTALQFATDSGLPKSILITSATPSEGKTITALAIARHFATMGQKVLLVDADLRMPSLHVRLGLDGSMGLSDYLTGACTPPEVMQRSDITNLTFMASGPLPPNAADLLGSPRVLSLLSIGLEVFDLIVLDGPPVMGLADAQLLSSSAAATVFVVGAGQARTGVIRGALKRLQLARGVLVGAVLTKFDAKQAGYGYGYGYGYGGYDYTYGRNDLEAPGDRAKLAKSA
ncbi:MAG TPA: polysaccharide biosynthesis tyrosine autokinase [Hyphomicrobiaceae bacterium]